MAELAKFLGFAKNYLPQRLSVLCCSGSSCNYRPDLNDI